MKARVLLPLTAVILLATACGTDFTPAQQCLRGRSVAAPGPAAAAPAGAAGEVLVRWSGTPTLPGALSTLDGRALQAAGVLHSHGLRVLETGSGSEPDLVWTAADPAETADRLMADPRVAWAVPNWRLAPLGDDCFQEQWNLADFGVAEAWGSGPGKHSVTVAVIDSGIDTDHPALKDSMLPGFNFYDMNTDPRPVMASDEHGSHVAGIIAASGNGPITGVAAFPERIRILPIRIFDDRGDDATFRDLLRALAWAVGDEVEGAPANTNPADIINLSVGAAVAPHAGMSAAIRDIVRERDVAVVAASGNDITGRFPTGIHAPANSGEAFAIGSTDSDFHRSYFSAYGGPASLTVLAPGGFGPSACGSVVSTIPGEDYGCQAGTSMAAPFVTGMLALLLTHEPGLTPAELEQRLHAAAWFDDSFMSTEQYGAGVLCANDLLSGRTNDGRGRC